MCAKPKQRNTYDEFISFKPKESLKIGLKSVSKIPNLTISIIASNNIVKIMYGRTVKKILCKLTPLKFVFCFRGEPGFQKKNYL